MGQMTANGWRKAADALIAALNAFDPVGVTALFTTDAVINDPSTGLTFYGHSGIADYVHRFFEGYHTVTRLLSMADLCDNTVSLCVDFTGDFGHEIGIFVIEANANGLIVRIDADLK